MAKRSAFVFCLLLGSHILAAHPISISWATLRAYEQQVDLQINILAEDLFLFHGLEPDESGFFSSELLLEAAGRHREFLARFFFLEDLSGNRLEPRFVRCQPFEMPAGGVHRDSLMQYGLLYFFEFRAAQPISGLQVFQQFGGSRSPIPAVVMATAYQDGAAGPLTAEIGRERPWLLAFDWEEPGNFGRQSHFSRFPQKAGPAAFLRIDEKGLSQEVEMPFEKMESLLPIRRAQEAFLDAEEERRAITAIAAFFTQNIEVEIDGRPCAPDAVRVDFGGSREAAGMPLAGARVKVSLEYSTGAPPAGVVARWALFNWQSRAWQAEISVFGKLQKHTFSRYQPVFCWKK